MILNKSVSLLNNKDLFSSCNLYSHSPSYSIMSATWEEKKLSFSCSLTLKEKGLTLKEEHSNFEGPILLCHNTSFFQDDSLSNAPDINNGSADGWSSWGERLPCFMALILEKIALMGLSLDAKNLIIVADDSMHEGLSAAQKEQLSYLKNYCTLIPQPVGEHLTLYFIDFKLTPALLQAVRQS